MFVQRKGGLPECVLTGNLLCSPALLCACNDKQNDNAQDHSYLTIDAGTACKNCGKTYHIQAKDVPKMLCVCDGLTGEAQMEVSGGNVVDQHDYK